MHDDLRRRALESRKTVSKKARSKQSSVPGTPLIVEAPQKDPGPGNYNEFMRTRWLGRDDSDDDDESSDAGSWSVQSEAEEDPSVYWNEDLSSRIDRILDRTRKNASAAGRAEDLLMYTSILRARYAQQLVSARLPELYAVLHKYLKDADEKQQLLVLDAVAMTTITDPNTHEGLAFESWGKPLQVLALNAESLLVKKTAILCLAIVTFFAEGAAEGDVMELLVSIVDTDGGQVDALDSPEVVSAAISAWSLLATLIDEVPENQAAADVAIDGLVDQLASADTAVQVAAGEAIALLYEKSYTEYDSDEEEPDVESDYDENDDDDIRKLKARTRHGAHLKKRFEPYPRKDQLLNTLRDLSKASLKSRSKQERRERRAAFADLAQSVYDGRLGPRFSSAIDHTTGQRYGSRLSVQVGPRTTMAIDKWWKLIRLKALRFWLKGGFLEHHQHNSVVLEMLPVLTSK